MRKRNVERMRYKNDTLSSGLCLLSILGNIVYFILIYSSSTVVPDYPIGVDVIINILFMLMAFWAGEQVKVYNRPWSIGIGVLGAIQLARLFWLPAMYEALGQLVGTTLMIVRVSLLASAVCLLAAAVTSFLNATALQKYLKGIETKS